MTLPLSLFLLAIDPILSSARPAAEEITARQNVPASPQQQQAVLPYAPRTVPCPASPLSRPADGLSQPESSYISSRYVAASSSLQQWLAKTNEGFGQPGNYPTLALATSGGGFRAMLTGAGVHQALDSRDGSTTVSGLYQAMTYESGLSGGGWLLGSITGNNWPTITTLQTDLFEPNLEEGLLLPDNIRAGIHDVEILAALTAKNIAGFPPTLVDAYGRLLGYALLQGNEGGISKTLSGITGQSGFTSSSYPFPITMAVGVDGTSGQCYPNETSPNFELTPYEFGSWDRGVTSFASTQYIGSTSNRCVNGYDNLGYVLGTTSDVLNGVCIPIPDPILEGAQDLTNALEDLVGVPNTADSRLFQAPYPNPFASRPTELDLADGGEGGQNVPIWPFLHRDIDVLFVTDASSDTDDNFPDGTSIHNTYVQAQANGLTRMPSIPDPTTFVAQGLNKGAHFFGCNDNNVITIIYLPNQQYSFDSGQETFKLQYSRADTDAMIVNGNAVGSFGGNATFGTCVGCAIMKKTGVDLPAPCVQCFADFCAS